MLVGMTSAANTAAVLAQSLCSEMKTRTRKMNLRFGLSTVLLMPDVQGCGGLTNNLIVRRGREPHQDCPLPLCQPHTFG